LHKHGDRKQCKQWMQICAKSRVRREAMEWDGVALTLEAGLEAVQPVICTDIIVTVAPFITYRAPPAACVRKPTGGVDECACAQASHCGKWVWLAC
jgi:hypothetical protein